MKNVDLLLKSNKISNRKIELKGGKIIIEITDFWFSGITLKKIAELINQVHKRYPKIKIPIEFRLGEILFIDKLTFVLFECICYDLVYRYGHYVQVFMSINTKDDIHIAGIQYSPLLLLNRTSRKTVMDYPKKFDMDLYGNHYRRVIDGSEKANTNYLGEIYTQIDSFLKPFGIEENSRDEIGIVISELVGNACEHGLSDCLIDIDVAPNYVKVVGNKPDGNDYFGINIVVVNLSDVLLGSGINKNVIKCESPANNRYETVIKAYKNHSKHFTQEYSCEDFCNITTFQHKISGRMNNDETGGTGLTKLIKSLEERSDAYRCYVISGSRSVNFYKELLEYNEENWIGFNLDKNYISQVPTEVDEAHKVVSESLMFMPGTAYNLNFVMKGEV